MLKPTVTMPDVSLMSEARVIEPGQARLILDTIDWSFSAPRRVSGLFDARRHHWYPATFIPEIPFTLIEVLAQPNAVLYDPFAGIGTTVFQSLALGHKAYATENSAIAVMVMKSLLTLLEPQTELPPVLHSGFRTGYKPAKDYSRDLTGFPIQLDRLQPWYAPETLNQLSYLFLCEAECDHLGAQAAVRISLSATLKAVSAQDRGYGCIADNVLPKPVQIAKVKNAIDQFEQRYARLLKDVLQFRRRTPDSGSNLPAISATDTLVFEGDVRKSKAVPDNSVDLIITSPPYPSMTDYSTAQRLSYYWLGIDPRSDLETEIGARRKRFSARASQQYLDDMKTAVDVFVKALKPNGYACLVLPSFEGDQVNNVERRAIMQECLTYLRLKGFVLEHEVIRILPSRRRYHNQKWAKLNKESIHIYRKV